MRGESYDLSDRILREARPLAGQSGVQTLQLER
jgi:hypothetical protein